MKRRKLLNPNKLKAIDKFNSEMSGEIGDIDKSIEGKSTNSGGLMDPIIPKDPNDLKLEIGTETGIPNDDLIDDYFMTDDMYVDTGDLIPREIIEEAERQFANERKDELD
ncbi:hypothetical protein SAMN05660297_02872 [Natronincola peptidivorans]|uniref:Uncharacterized protein n=1 Tax=Natronincola peptidivorans TaxID=426128 RepID=A0A1I0FMG7_9FIRM|nr:hypothetical protein [Natronincola peptidivorans]SET59511.1 hypothetical protein SAMN05660297_02872 [Natronincola peptidivorans]